VIFIVATCFYPKGSSSVQHLVKHLKEVTKLRLLSKTSFFTIKLYFVFCMVLMYTYELKQVKINTAHWWETVVLNVSPDGDRLESKHVPTIKRT
jgi:hypothetical protein